MRDDRHEQSKTILTLIYIAAIVIVAIGIAGLLGCGPAAAATKCPVPAAGAGVEARACSH